MEICIALQVCTAVIRKKTESMSNLNLDDSILCTSTVLVQQYPFLLGNESQADQDDGTVYF